MKLPALRRFHLVLLSLFGVLAQLAFDARDGAVTAHHLLADPGNPAVSNLWGLLTVPALTWGMTTLAARRHRAEAGAAQPEPGSILARSGPPFLAAFLFGALFSLLWTLGVDEPLRWVILLPVGAALLYPVFRPECVLGCVYGMSFAFGGVLPIIVAAVLCALSAPVWFLLGRPLRRVLSPR